MKSSQRRSARFAVAISVSLAFIAGACSSDKASEAKTTTPATTPATEAAPADTTPATEAAPADTTPATEAPADTAAPEGGATDFTSLEAFCVAGTDAAPTDLTASDQGVTADAVTVLHVRAQLEKLAAIGFGIDVGDVTSMWNAFADETNACGGVNGRKIDLKTIEYDVIDAASRDGVCVAATEDNTPFVVMSSTAIQGSANQCIAVDKQTPLINSQGVGKSLYDTGYYITTDLPQEVSFNAEVLDLIAQGKLEGKKVGIITADLGDLNKRVEASMQKTLEDNGIEVSSFDVLGCNGTSTCNDGVSLAVENFGAAGSQVFLPAGLGITALPTIMKEFATQGVKPEVIYQSGAASAGGDLPTSKVLEFGGQEAADLYNNTEIIDYAATGVFRTNPDFDPGKFSEMCADTYAKHGGKRYIAKEDPIIYGMVGTVCSQFRVMLRALQAAGNNPTRQGFVDAVQGLGKVDALYDTPSSLSKGKTWFPDALHTNVASFPCPVADVLFPNGCVVPKDFEYRPIQGL